MDLPDLSHDGRAKQDQKPSSASFCPQSNLCSNKQWLILTEHPSVWPAADSDGKAVSAMGDDPWSASLDDPREFTLPHSVLLEGDNKGVSF